MKASPWEPERLNTLRCILSPTTAQQKWNSNQTVRTLCNMQKVILPRALIIIKISAMEIVMCNNNDTTGDLLKASDCFSPRGSPIQRGSGLV